MCGENRKGWGALESNAYSVGKNFMTFSLPQSRQCKTGVEISKTIGKVKPPQVASPPVQC